MGRDIFEGHEELRPKRDVFEGVSPPPSRDVFDHIPAISAQSTRVVDPIYDPRPQNTKYGLPQELDFMSGIEEAAAGLAGRVQESTEQFSKDIPHDDDYNPDPRFSSMSLAGKAASQGLYGSGHVITGIPAFMGSLPNTVLNQDPISATEELGGGFINMLANMPAQTYRALKPLLNLPDTPAGLDAFLLKTPAALTGQSVEDYYHNAVKSFQSSGGSDFFYGGLMGGGGVAGLAKKTKSPSIVEQVKKQSSDLLLEGKNLTKLTESQRKSQIIERLTNKKPEISPVPEPKVEISGKKTLLEPERATKEQLGEYEYHFSNDPNLIAGKSFADQTNINKGVKKRGVGNIQEEGIYSTNKPDFWHGQMKVDLGKDAPQNIYLVKVKKGSPKGMLESGIEAQSVNKPQDVTIIKKLKTTKDGIDVGELEYLKDQAIKQTPKPPVEKVILEPEKALEKQTKEKIWFHGTNKKFDKFKIKTTGDLGRGHYLTNSVPSAKNFAWQKSYAKGGKQNIIIASSDISPKNILILGEGKIGKEAQKIYNAGSSEIQTGSQIEALAKKHGYDAVYRESGAEVELLVFKGDNVNVLGQGNKNIYKDLDKVKKALSEGKPVPESVLKDYPDLKPVKDKPVSEAPKGMAKGTSGRPVSMDIPKAFEPKKSKPVAVRDIKNYLSKSLKVPIRVGHMGTSPHAGYYKSLQQVTRQKDIKDVGVMTHEVAHHIDNKYGIKPVRLRSRELSKLDYYYPKQKRTSEGFAEYIRGWLTGADDVIKKAPEFTKKFNNFLKTEPELKAVLDNAKGMITQWREQGAVERVYSQIDIKGKTPSRLKEKISHIGRIIHEYTIDDLVQLEYAEKQMRGVKNLEKESRAGRLRPSTSPTMIARDVAKKANSKARSMILDGTFDYTGKQTGISLRDALSPVSKDMKDFLSYAYSKRALDLKKRDINAGIEISDANYVVHKLETPSFKKSLKEVVAFQDRVMQYAVDAGVVSAETAKSMRDMNPIYIPLKRSFEMGEWTSTGGKRLANISSPFKRIKGSGRAIKHPLNSIIENTAQIINTADKVRVGKALIELGEKTKGSGKWIEEIPTPKTTTKVRTQRILDELAERGVEFDLKDTDLAFDDMMTFYSNMPQYIGKENIVTFWKDGKRKFYEVHPDLSRTLKAIDPIQLGVMLNIFGAPARAIRLGATGLRPGFSLITNPLRDMMGFALQTEFTSGLPHHIMKGFYKKVNPKDPMKLLWQRSGGDMAQYLGLDKKSLKSAVDEVLASDKKMKALNVVKHPIEVLKEVFSITESAPRLGEFSGAYKKGEKLYGKGSASARVMASGASADVTVNFGRMGVYVSTLNQLIPFFNAQIQGVHRFTRFMRAHPIKGAIKAAASVTAPTVTLWMVNKDEQWYKELPDWQKYGFWNFYLGKNKDKSARILRIPRPFEWGIAFGSGPEAVLNYWNTKDKNAFKSAHKHMIDQIVPGVLPAFIQAPVEQWANYDFFRDRAIDPYFQVKHKDPEDRFSSYTTRTAKFIGKQFGLSPRRIEHLLGSTTGGLGLDLLRSAEGAYTPSKMDKPSKYPIVGRLFTHTLTPAERSERLKYLQSGKKKKLIIGGK